MRVLGTLVLLGAITTPPAAAQSVLYELDPASDYLEGCYEPCDCLLQLFDDLTGTFELAYVGTGPDWYTHYDVSNVDWTIGTPSGPLHVTGSGTYAIGGQLLPSQQLSLDLAVGGASPVHFDSGTVFGSYSFPVIDVAIAMNGFFCYDRVFELHSAPVSIGPSYCTAAPNSVGPGTTLSVVGSATVADGELGLVAQSAPPGEFGVFFFGSATTQVPFGDGFLCAAGSVFRIQPPQAVDPWGDVFRGVDLGAPPAAGNLLPGSTWNFQFWYRDPAGGPAGFNLSDGVSVAFH